MNTTTKAPATATLAGYINDRTWIGHAEQRKTFEGEVPRDEALAFLDIPVQEFNPRVPILTDDGVVEFTDENNKGIVRTDTQDVFRYFKPGYKMHRYPEWLVEDVDIIISGGLKIGTVALTKGGARAFLQAELPEGRIATAPGAEPVKHTPHMTAATSLDGSIATTFGIGTRKWICENEMSLAGWRGMVKSFQSFTKIRHTSGSLSRIGEVRANLGLFVVEEIGDAFEQEFRELVSQSVTDARFQEVIAAYSGIHSAKEGRSKTIAQGKVDALTTLWKDDERVAPWRGSAYGVLAAFNTAQHHVFGADKGREERNHDRVITDEWAKFDSNVLSLLASV